MARPSQTARQKTGRRQAAQGRHLQGPPAGGTRAAGAARTAAPPPSLRALPDWITNGWVWLLAGMATLALYWTTVHYKFLLDDIVLFKNSASLHDLSSIWRGFHTDIGAVRKGGDATQGSYYRPLFLALSTLYFQLAGPSTEAWHLASVAVAAAAAALVALLFLRLGFSPLLSLLAAAVFALHPTHVSSVAWTSGIQESQAAFFVLLSVVILLSPAAEKRPRTTLALAAAAFACALLSKEVAIGLFPMTVAWAFLDRRIDPERARRFRRAIPLFGTITATYLVVRILALGSLVRPWIRAPGLVGAAPSLPLAFMTYVHLLVWPTAFSVARPERPAWGLALPGLLGAVAFVVLAALAWFGARKRPAILLPVAWFTFFLAPVMNYWALFPEWMITDRYVYLPSLALPWLLLLLLPPKARVPVLVLVIAAFAFLSHRYAAIFESPKIFTDAMAVAEPTSSLILEEKARVFMVEGKLAAAEATFRRALVIDPIDAYSLWKVGVMEVRRGDYAAAERDYRQALIEEPENSQPFTSLATALITAGQRDHALALLDESVRRWPSDYEPRLLEALLLLSRGRRAQAEQTFAIASATHPHEPILQAGLDKAMATIGPALGLSAP